MLYLYPENEKITTAKEEFHQGVMDIIFKRIDDFKRNNKYQEECFFDIVINPIIDDILIGRPQKLIEIHTQLISLINASERVKKGIKHVFNYDYFSQKRKTNKLYNAYDLAKALDINTCPYCNRNLN
jgi:hypothetical protein